MRMESSILEMMVALSETASFQTGMPPNQWFWIMLSNAELDQFTDSVYDDDVHGFIMERLSMITHRTYDYSGRGGFFPLREPGRDQRKVELWYQLSAYLIENFEF